MCSADHQILFPKQPSIHDRKKLGCDQTWSKHCPVPVRLLQFPAVFCLGDWVRLVSVRSPRCHPCDVTETNGRHVGGPKNPYFFICPKKPYYFGFFFNFSPKNPNFFFNKMVVTDVISKCLTWILHRPYLNVSFFVGW